MYDPDNIFARILRGEIPCARVYEDDHVLAFRDIAPKRPVHVLVIPREHVPTLSEAKDPALVGRLALLAAEIAEREGIVDGGYRTVINTNADAEVPIIVSLSPLDLDDIRLVDRDVILVRSDVGWSDPESQNFLARFSLTVGGFTIEVIRGWSAVDILAGDTGFRFVNTHLETFVPQIQILQAQQLLGVLAAEPLPVAMVGDFNSEADGSTTPTYGMVTELGGFTAARPPQGGGFTSCHADHPTNLPANHDQRIDSPFLRGHFRLGPPGFLGGDQFKAFLDEDTKRIAAIMESLGLKK